MELPPRIHLDLGPRTEARAPDRLLRFRVDGVVEQVREQRGRLRRLWAHVPRAAESRTHTHARDRTDESLPSPTAFSRTADAPVLNLLVDRGDGLKGERIASTISDACFIEPPSDPAIRPPLCSQPADPPRDLLLIGVWHDLSINVRVAVWGIQAVAPALLPDECKSLGDSLTVVVRLKLGDGADDVEVEPARSGCRVYLPVERDEVRVGLAQATGDGRGIDDVPSEATEAVNDQCAAVHFDTAKRCFKSGPVGSLPPAEPFVCVRLDEVQVVCRAVLGDKVSLGIQRDAISGLLPGRDSHVSARGFTI